jgi:hypothetical protein
MMVPPFPKGRGGRECNHSSEDILVFQNKGRLLPGDVETSIILHSSLFFFFIIIGEKIAHSMEHYS